MRNLLHRLTGKLKTKSSAPYPIISQPGRVRLQPFDDTHLDRVRTWFEDRETCELAFGVKASWDALSTIRSEYLEELQKDKVGVLSILKAQEKDQSALIGFVRYKLFRKGLKSSARVGIILGPGARGQGIGRESFQTLLFYLFEKRKVATIDLDTALFNTKAQACFEACGFQSVREVEFTSINTDWVEKRLLMRLTAKDWRKLFPGNNATFSV